MNPVLEDILATGEILLESGERVPVSSQVDPESGALLQRAIAEVRPSVVVEVGLAYGVSTLYMLDALASSGGKKLIGMDPAQFDKYWRGGGLNNIERAGYSGMYEFHESTSQQSLPMLAARGERVGLGFVDGWHTFDHTLVDFFYIDQMLDVGGIVVFDDVGYPSIFRLCEFVLTNRSYEIYGTVEYSEARSIRQRVEHFLRGSPLPLCRTAALRKTAEDDRRWDHFVRF